MERFASQTSILKSLHPQILTSSDPAFAELVSFVSLDVRLDCRGIRVEEIDTGAVAMRDLECRPDNGGVQTNRALFVRQRKADALIRFQCGRREHQRAND